MLGWLLALVYAVCADEAPIPLPAFSNPSNLVLRPTALDQLGLDDLFFSSSFQRQVFHGHSGAHLNVSLDRLLSLLSEQDLISVDMRVDEGRNKMTPTSLKQLQELLSSNRDSLVFHTRDSGALELSSAVSALKRELTKLFQTPVTANLYVSGSHSAALPPHTDTTDTIVVQEQGRKAWIFCVPKPEMRGDLHLSNADLAEIQEARIGRLKGCSNYVLEDVLRTMSCTNLTMVPGDVLYIPKGIVHMAREMDGATSVHLTLALTREGFSFRALMEQALLSSAIEKIPAVSFFGQESMPWKAVFQKAIKQMETSDSGVAVRRSVPMWLLGALSPEGVVFDYYQQLLVELRVVVFQVLKEIADHSMISLTELEGTAESIIQVLGKPESFTAASSSLFGSTRVANPEPDCSLEEEYGHTSSRHLLSACNDQCTNNYYTCRNGCPKCSCDGTCNDGCNSNCDASCDEGCATCTAPSPCNAMGTAGACWQACNLDCSFSCDDSCDGNCNDNCTSSCDDWCSSPCLDNCAAIQTGCFGNCVTCPATVNFTQAGNVTYSNSTRLGSIATFTCLPGFALSSSSTRVCQINEQWSGSNPTCQPRQCNPPPIVPYSTYTPTTGLSYRLPPFNSATNFTIITWTCIDGYFLNGTTTSTCLSNLTWTASPICQDIDECAAPINPCIGGTCNNTNGGYTCTCDYGYTLNDRTCVGQTCQPLTVPMSGAILTFNQTRWLNATTQINTITNSSGSFTCPYKCSAVLTCPTGYLPDPSVAAGIKCYAPADAFGFVSWNFVSNAQTLSCVGIPCQPSPANGPITAGVVNWPVVNGQVKTLLRYQDSIEVVCNLGYLPFGASLWKCGVIGINSTWNCLNSTGQGTSCSAPSCIGRPCAAIPSISNGNATISSSIYPSIISYTCNPGYNNLGTDGNIGTCDAASGQWKNGVPYCVGKPCGFPASGIATNTPTYSNLGTFPSVATYVCQTNFYSGPNMTTSCTTAGTWPTGPTCYFRLINSTGNLSSTFAPTPIQISGLFGNGVAVNVTFGPYGQTNMFACTSPSMNSTTVTCIAPKGVGANYYMVITSSEFGNTLNLPKYGVSFAQPVITKVWGWTSSGLNLVNATNFLKSDTRFGGDFITIQGQHFGTDATKLTVMYGLRYSCSNVANVTCTSSLNCTLVCITARGAGALLKFRVGAGPTVETIGWSLPSVTTFSYPDGPSVSTVSGCSPDPDQPAGTMGCPTNGGVRVSLTGKVFVDPAFNTSVPIVTIGSSTCGVVSFNSTYIVCTLSAGTGFAQTVAVMVGDLSGDAQPLLSFAAATVTNVTGCFNRTGCRRIGGDIITVNGKDFGADKAKIIIGGQLCNNTIHRSYNQLTCVLASGKGLSQLISVLQYDGQYTTTTWTIDYEVCGMGKYDLSPSTTNCVNCAPGKYTELTNRQFCDVCPLGRYQPAAGRSSCDQAQYGQYVNDTGLTIVFNCSVGSYSPQLGGQSCTLCEAGRANNLVKQQSCVTCATGRAQSAPGKTDCVDCAPGFYQSSLGMVVCNPCPLGTVAPGVASPSCDNCLPGSYANVSLNCAPCVQGLYADRSLSTACDVCGPGKFSTGPGLSSCSACSTGTYQDSYSKFSCLPCLSGTYQQAQAASSCDKCSPGYFSNASLATFCYYCDAGYFTRTLGLTVCSMCVSGTYARDIRQSACSNCDPGTFSNVSGSTSCTNCILGRAAQGFGSTTCPMCKAGTANSASGQPACLPCDYGTSSGADGASICDVCTPGQFAAAIASTNCADCVAGRFSAGNRSSACDPCPAGAVSTAIGATRCQTCTVGRIAAASGATVCVDCLAGMFSGLTGSTGCISCNPGYFSNMSATIACPSCPAGSISDAPRSTICTVCDIGYFSLTSASTSCTRCPLGEMGNTTGATACTICQPGTFTAISGLTICADCEKGSYSAVTSSKYCSPCAMGYFANVSAQKACTQCPVGTYQDSTGSTYCIECAPGYFLPTAAGSICAQCPRGRFSNGTATIVCTICLAGYYSDNTGSTACFACPVGKISDSDEAKSCQACDRGKYNPTVANTSCTRCDPGYFAPQSGLANCSSCNPGTFAAGFGNEYCRACDAGKFGNSSAASGCDSCQVGRFSAVPNSQDCISCDPGTFSSDSNSPTFCAICTRGYFQNKSAATFCEDCPKGSYGSNERMSTCQLCPAGKFRDTVHAQDCVACIEGTFANATGSTVCIACSPGSYSASIGTASCILCALGQYTEKTNALGCQSCELGHYSGGLGASVCLQCPTGRYQNEYGASRCLDCIPGKFALMGFTECSPCAPQTANPWFGMGQCYRCADEAYTSEVGDVCICPPGSFAPDRDQNMSIFPCTTCNPGFDCTLKGVTFASLAVMPGWWRTDNLQLTASACVLLAHCAGGHNSTCGPNRAGVLCAFCEDGYTASGTGKTGACTQCPESKSGSYAVIVLGSLGALAALAVIYYIVLISDRDVVASLRRKRMKDLGLVETTSEDKSDSKDSKDSLSESRLSSNSTVGEDASMSSVSSVSDKKEKKNAVTAGASGAETRIRPNVVYKMKIVAGFLQILTNLTLSVTMPWPKRFRAFMLVFSFLNLDFLPWGTVGCVASLEYVDKIVIICSLPFFALFIGGIAIIVLHFYAKGQERPITLQIGRFRVLKLFAWTLFLLYPFLCATILKYFVCRNINGEIFLVADFAVKCYSDKWYKSLPVAVIATIVYPVGIPVAFGVFLYFNRKRLDELEMRLKFGFLVDAYHRSTWWFEMVWSLNGMFCVSLVAFFPTSIQIQTAMVWLVSFVIILLLTRPYIRKGEDRLALLCMLEIVLLLMFCLVLVQYNGVIEDSTDWVMSVGMIAMVCLTLLVGLAIAIKNIYKILRRWRFSWKKRKGQTNKPTLGAPSSSLVQERLDKNATVLEGRLANSTGTASNTFEKDLAKFNFSTW